MSCHCGYAIGDPRVPVCSCKKKKKKEWVGLTDEEKAIWKEPAIAAVLWTEAKLKEKNGY